MQLFNVNFLKYLFSDKEICCKLGFPYLFVPADNSVNFVAVSNRIVFGVYIETSPIVFKLGAQPIKIS